MSPGVHKHCNASSNLLVNDHAFDDMWGKWKKTLSLRNCCSMFQAKALLSRAKKNSGLRICQLARGLTKMTRRHIGKGYFDFSYRAPPKLSSKGYFSFMHQLGVPLVCMQSLGPLGFIVLKLLAHPFPTGVTGSCYYPPGYMHYSRSCLCSVILWWMW